MFRNKPFQRIVAAVVLTVFNVSAPVLAAESVKGLPTVRSATVPGTINGVPLIPLAPKSGPSTITTSSGTTTSGNTGAKGVTTITVNGNSSGNSNAAGSTANSNASSNTSTANKPVTTPTIAQYSQALAKLSDLSKQPVTNAKAAALQVTALRNQYRIVQQYEAQAAAAFSTTEAFLRSKNLPPEIIARHQAMVAQYAARNAELAAVMQILNGATANNAQAALTQLAALLTKYANLTGPAQANLSNNGNPGKLPWGNHKANTKKVALTPKEHETLFPRSIQIASNGSLSGISLPNTVLGEAPLPGDIADPDAQITPEIRTLAASFKNPVQLYNWVRDNISLAVGYGISKSAALTLASRRGTDADIANLLVALYRASPTPTPARYVYGTVEIPIARLQNLLGLDNAQAVQTLLTQAGIPNQAVMSAGQISAIQLEHMWVEAFVDYTPSRGARNLKPDTWVPLDASFKLTNPKPGLNLRQAIGFNEAGLFDAAKQGAACTADSAQHLNAAAIQTAYANYKTQLNTYLSQQGPNLTVGDVLGTSSIVPEDYSIFMGTLPYKTVSTGAVMNVLPDNLRWQFRYQLFADSTAQAQGNPTVALTGSMASLTGKRITLSFTPATAADAATLAAYMPKAHANGSPIQASEFPADVPGYLINVTAELRADGQLIAAGGSFVLGSELVADLSSYDPSVGNWTVDTNYPHAGDYQAIVIDPQGISAAQLNTVKARLAATQAALSNPANTLTRDDVTGDLLYQTALDYFATADANASVFQRAAGTVDQRMPSYGRAIAPAIPHMVLGTINKVSFPGVQLDIDRMSNAVAVKNGGLDAVSYNRQSNERNAAYAYLTLEKLYTSAAQPGEAVSAVKVLANAAAQTQPADPVTALTTANLAGKLPGITLSATAGTDVQNAVAAGFRVTVAQNPATIGAWTGEAMQIEDMTTGAGEFRIRADNASDNSAATAALYLQGTNGSTPGMGWLAQALPFQAAVSITPSMQAGQTTDDVLASMLDNADTTRWAFFAGQSDVANGLFLARLAAAQGSQTCDSAVGILAARLDTTTGFENPPTPVAAPNITSQPVTAGQAGTAYRYAVIATDPNNANLSYSLSQAPSGMSVDSTGVITWASPIIGSSTVTVRVDNGKAYVEQSYILTIGSAAIPLQVEIAANPQFIDLNQTTTITVVTNGGTGNVTTTLKVDGQPVALNASGQATITGTAMGAHPISVTATDSKGTQTRTTQYSVRNPADTTPPVAIITSPVDSATVTNVFPIIGTASDANLAYYTLQIQPNDGSTAWQEIGRGTTSVTNSTLGTLDPTQLPNAIYNLLLTVVDINGQTAAAQIPVEINGALKVGQFSISFQDLNVDAVGVPIRITRTYDTRRKSESLDFGYGWTVDYQSVQLSKSMVMGLQWNLVTSNLTQCLRPDGVHKVNITLPNGHVERFSAANETECANTGVTPPLHVIFSPLSGTTSQLEIINVNVDLMLQGGQIVDTVNFVPWNPTEYKLTTEDHYIYYITEGIGIVQIKDPSGNTLTYGQNGIIHSNGQSVAFTRDANNRITQITDPAGNSLNYVYTATGDLTSVISRTNATSVFHYNGSHGLTDYTDPRGVMTARYVYDDNGLLIAAYDATGKAIQTTHDTANNQEIVTDRRGNTTTYTYDSAGNVVKTVDALGHVTTSTFDTNGNELTTTDANGKTTTRTFDSRSGKLLTETDPLGHTTSSAYDITTGTQLQSVTDASGNTSSIMYLNFGQNIVQPLGSSVLVRTDPGGGGNLNSLTINGQTTSYTYDGKGNRLSETDASGNVINYTYDANNKEISRSWTHMVMVNGSQQQQTVTTTRTLDASGNVLAETDALGFTTKTEYNAGGQITAMVDPQGRRTTYDYDARFKLAKTTYPDGSFEAITYDDQGNQATTTDRQGRVTQYQYDALNRLVKTIAPDGSTTGTEYDAAGRVSAEIDAGGNRTINTYDDAGRLQTVIDANNKTTKFAYDANGNRTDVWDANGQHTQFTFDALNRLTTTTYPDGKIAGIVWNVNGTKQSETDRAGNTTTFSYDPMGRLSGVTQTNAATSQVTNYGFDNLGNKISQTDAENHTTTWTYNAANRVASRTLPSGQTENFSYDALNHLTAKTDFLGQATSIGYDALSQPNLVVRPDASLVSTYTPSGQVASLVATVSSASGLQGGATSYTYDAQDRLTRQTNPDGSFLAYGFDAAGNITQRSFAAGTVNYSYDANGQLASVIDISGKATSYTYDAVGRPSTIGLPNGTKGSYSYDINGRLQQLAHQKTDGSIVAGVRYTLADNGQRTRLEEYDSVSTLAANVLTNPARTYDYLYDPVGRLTQDKRTDRGGAVVRTTTYLYDKVGNRTTKTEITSAGTTTTAYLYDANDRLTTETTTPPTGSAIITIYAWNANGNLISKTIGAQSTFYTWNSDNRLTVVKQGASEATAIIIAKFIYDASGNRIGKVEPGQNGQPDRITTYLIDSSFGYAQVVLETVTQGSTTTMTAYTWGNGLIAQTRTGQQNYFYGNGSNSTMALADGTGNITDTYAYDAFGNIENRTGTTTNAYRYVGEYFDDAIGDIYLRDRWLDPSVGRFVSMDRFSGSASRPITLNKYAYANGDPVDGTDPSGRMTLGELGEAIDVQGILTGIARDQVTGFIQSQIFGNDAEVDGQPSLFEMVMASVLKSVAGSVSATTVVAGAAVIIALAAPGGTEKHHVIPEYMCGAKTQIDLVNLYLKDHKVLHTEMNRYEKAVDVAGIVYDVIFKRKTKGIFMSKVNEIARTPQGRTAITIALEAFYYENGWFDMGSGVITHAPIGFVLAFEAPDYIAKNHKYSKTVPCKG